MAMSKHADRRMGESSSIDIENLRGKLPPSLNPFSTSCIYRVDKRIRKIKEDAYTPDTVSIGPYHCDLNKQNLQMQDMEHLKKRYVSSLLDRERTTLEEYVKELEKLETEARDCYLEPTKSGIQENFVEIMLFDGLFIIELFRKFSYVVGTERNDPIFNSNLRRTRVVRDLLLLENQIPMLVLQTLFDLSYDPNSDRLSLINLALNFFKDLISDDMDYYTDLQNIEPTGHKHLLDLLSYALENSLPAMVLRLASRAALESLPCVTELQHSGVNFRKRLTRSGWMDIEFRDGVFEIPTLRVDEYTDPFFRKLIAYEQHRSGGRHYITSYALLMDSLIDSADDVAFLRRHKIIVNHLGDDSKVSSLFNSLCTEVVTNNFYYKDLCDDVRQYYYSPYNEWKATWMREYCNSPWTIIPVVAAVFLLFLTVWATLFTTLPVFNVNFKH